VPDLGTKVVPEREIASETLPGRVHGGMRSPELLRRRSRARYRYEGREHPVAQE